MIIGLREKHCNESGPRSGLVVGFFEERARTSSDSRDPACPVPFHAAQRSVFFGGENHGHRICFSIKHRSFCLRPVGSYAHNSLTRVPSNRTLERGQMCPNNVLHEFEVYSDFGPRDSARCKRPSHAYFMRMGIERGLDSTHPRLKFGDSEPRIHFSVPKANQWMLCAT